MAPLENTTETTETETPSQFMFHLKSRKAMRYDISKQTAPVMPTLGKGTECINLLLRRPQKTCTNPLFRCFSLFLAHTPEVRNFSRQDVVSLSTSRNFVGRDP